MVSNGLACTSASVESSHVLSAMGVGEGDCYSSVRLSLGRFSGRGEMDIAVKAIEGIVASLRLMNA